MYVTQPAFRPLGALTHRLCRRGEEFCDDTCLRNYQSAKQRDPSKFACVSDAIADRMISICEAQRRGEIESYEARRMLDEAFANSCADLRVECQDLFAQWAQAHPADAACLTDQQIQTIVTNCTKAKVGRMAPQTFASQLQDFIAACAAHAPEPVAAPMPPPPIEEQIFQPGPEQGGVVPMPEEPAMYTQEPLRSQPQAQSSIRKWGPVVGVLLVVGGAVYLLR